VTGLQGAAGGAFAAEAYLAPETIGQVGAFELRARMIAEGISTGMHRSPYQGAAVEFAEHRAYAPGDDLRHVDWKVFGRTDKLYLKRFQQETTLDVLVLVDASGSMRYGSLEVKSGWGGTRASAAATREAGGRRRWTKFDHATATAAALAYLSLQQRDRVGVGVIADGLVGGLRRRGARGQWRSIVQTLATSPVEGRADLVKGFEQALATSPNRMLVALVSDLLGPIDALRTVLARCRHARHDLLLLQVLDRQELRFEFDEPAPFEGLEGEATIEADPRAVRSAYLEALEAQIGAVRSAAIGFGYDHLLMDSHESVGPALSALLARRAGMLRRGKAT
jgi:uncharacterized protein (DUF58 family)